MTRRLSVTARAIVVACFAGSAGAQSAGKAQLQADADWQDLVSSGPRAIRELGEDSLDYFMREVEIADQRTRELGIRFWEKHPEDPRRYKWLLLTVHMPPRYAKNMHEWARNEARLTPNAAAIDRAALQSWEDRYPAMREAFWAAPVVTAVERGDLRATEIEQEVLRMQEAVARGESADVSTLLNQVLEFAKTLRVPIPEADWDGRGSAAASLSVSVLESSRALGIDNEGQDRFIGRLRATGNSQALNAAEKAIARLRNEANASQIAVSKSGAAWGRLAALTSHYEAPARTVEGAVAAWHARIIMARKYREVGLRLWDQYPDLNQRALWLFYTQVSYPTYYLAAFTEGIRQLAGERADPPEFDWQAQEEWSRRAAQMRAALLKDRHLELSDRVSILHASVAEKMWLVEQRVREKRADTGAAAMLKDIHELYTRYGRGGLSASLAGQVFQRSSRYRLAEKELRAFIAPMFGYQDEELREFAQAKERLFQLRRTGVTLKAPTLAGAPFDLSALRGKIVLIDYWATTCSSCISSMPRIKAIYDRYRPHGFEVVSVCMDATRQRRKVERAERELGLTWTTLAADALWPEFKTRYGFEGVPQYMLLDRQGKLVAATGEINGGRNLEALLSQMLAEERKRPEPTARDAAVTSLRASRGL